MLGFNFKKSVQSLNYFAIAEGGKANKMKVLKLIWLADRVHLRRYGRPILNDTYFALNYGPVASNTKDFLEATSFLSAGELEYRNNFIAEESRYNYASTAKCETEIFSETDKKVLREIKDNFIILKPFQLSELSHLYPEWKKFETQLKSRNASRFHMDYQDFFSNPSKEVNASVFSESEEELKMTKEIFTENGYIYKLI